jgi:hypothetical protein
MREAQATRPLPKISRNGRAPTYTQHPSGRLVRPLIGMAG